MARNNGIAASRGYFILPLDSDDMIDSTYLEKAVDYFKKRPDYDNTVGYNPNMKGGGGFVVAYAQWKLQQPFRVLLESYPLERILSNYHLMHEADISKMVELIQEEL